MTTVERPPVIPVGTLYPCCACLCCMNSVVCNSFDCVGIYSRDACCCIQVDNYCCKYTKEPGYDCIVYRSECMKGDCRACCQTEKQFCCFDFRCQDRKTDEQPCICTMLFFTCYYKDERICSCFKNIESMESVISGHAAANNTGVEMTPNGRSARQNSHRPNVTAPEPILPMAIPSPGSSPRPGSYSPHYVPDTMSTSSRGNYTPVGLPSPPPVVARTVSASAVRGDIPLAMVVYT